jgi:hypothetical protein
MAQAQTGETFTTVAAQQAFVAKTCAGCHNDKLKTGGFTWSKIDLNHPEQEAELTEKVIHILRAGMMPPPGIPRPDRETMDAFIVSLERSIDKAAMAQPNPGAPSLHRLNRTEYHNAIRDLLGLDIDVSQLLPADDASHGFDNMSDVLGVSPALMEGFIRAADKISREAVGDMQIAATSQTFHIPRVVNQNRHVEGTPFGTRGGLAATHNFPADGEYVFRLSLYYDICGPLWGKSQGKGQTIEVSVDGERVALMQIDPNSTFTDDLVTPSVKVTAGPHKVTASFPSRGEGPVEDTVMPFEQSLLDLNNADMPGITSLPHLRELRIVGPKNVTGLGNTPSRKRIFTCRPAAGADEVPCAREIISRLAKVAYRRPAAPADLEDLLSVYQRGRNGKNGDFEAGIRTVIQTLISDPEFVFRFERTPGGIAPGTNYRISDLELASRLSFFLWSSIPDAPLIDAAAKNQLHEPAELEKQIRRMLGDSRSSALSTNFAGQWLTLPNLKEMQPDAFMFPNYNMNLGDSMRKETEMLFDSIVHEDHSILDLLTADYTFVDETLAKHYGIPDVLGTRFRRVPITDERRKGLLGQGSVLTLTSVANRTSPVQRGKWVMITLLGSPPPPPPPNVPPLKENEENQKQQSVREKMEAHRKNEPCRSCHQLMDPIGLSLENYDAIGQWRLKDAGVPVDANGKMYDGAPLDGPLSLRKAILNHSDAYIGTFTERLLSYALGRVVDYRDMPMLRGIEQEAGKNGDKFSSFVFAIAKSAPFQMRRAEVVAAPTAGGNQ